MSRKFLFAVCCVFAAMPALAAQGPLMPPAGIDQEQGRIQQQQQQLLENLLRERELREAEAGRPRTGPETPPQPGKSSAGAGRCVEIREIEFSGNTALPDSRVREMLSPYEGRCLALEEINAALLGVANAYIGEGFLTSRAFMVMPQPRLREGVLVIKIYEGRLSAIEGLKGGERATAFPFMLEKVLNLREVEQGLDQMNRLGSNKATVTIEADETREGYSRLIIKNEAQKRTSLGVTFDSFGSSSTGEWRAGARLAQDNLLGLNDQISLFYTNSVVPDPGNRASRSFLFGMSIPMGWWTFSNNFAYSSYKTSFPMPISGDRFYFLGDSFSENFSAERMLARGQAHKFAAVLGFTYKDNRNHLEVYDLRVRNDASSRRLAVLNLDMPLTLYFNGGMLYIKPGMAHGIRAFGSFSDQGSPYSQKAQYNACKLYMYSGWDFGKISLTTSIDSQYTTDELFSTEAFHLGGTSVRGLKDESAQGDSGFYVMNDLSLNLGRIFNSPNSLLASFTPGVFLDYGQVFSNARTGESVSLAGAGAKLAFRRGMLDASVSWAAILAKGDWMEETSAVYAAIGLSGRF
ncbi:MAG: ShlB/FhaC/HecB family hemolysin secretion/activation protein [Desulfovibrionaceae bacterium]|nr:ShlB/FhaC/HecB family hemolysin secretion/activation protein [Desulfovibrionaceae bacterium]